MLLFLLFDEAVYFLQAITELLGSGSEAVVFKAQLKTARERDHVVALRFSFPVNISSTAVTGQVDDVKNVLSRLSASAYILKPLFEFTGALPDYARAFLDPSLAIRFTEVRKKMVISKKTQVQVMPLCSSENTYKHTCNFMYMHSCIHTCIHMGIQIYQYTG